MIKVSMFSDKEVLWHLGYDKETELQKAVETAPNLIFFYIDFLEVVEKLLEEGLTDPQIARHLNMNHKDLREAWLKAFEKDVARRTNIRKNS